jgi:anaerobic dimethyl sulfoxide reductase subunit C (anchor subunit)
MNRDDLSLVAFTLLVQLALGAVFAAAMLPLRLAGQADPGHLVEPLLYAAAPALGVALSISLLHLGTPSGAVRALRNLGTSWLSREVLFTGLFAALTVAAAVLYALSRPSPNLLWLAGLTGLAALYSMARLYQTTFRPAWATGFTPVSFFAAALTLGTAAGATAVMAALRAGALTEATAQVLLHDMVLTGAVALAAHLTALPLWTAALGGGRQPAGRLALGRLAGPLALPMAARLVAAAAGMIALAYGWHFLSLPFVAAGAVLLGAAEVLGRILFFATGVPTAVGQ